jgi:hypothetical protein
LLFERSGVADCKETKAFFQQMLNKVAAARVPASSRSSLAAVARRWFSANRPSTTASTSRFASAPNNATSAASASSSRFAPSPTQKGATAAAPIGSRATATFKATSNSSAAAAGIGGKGIRTATATAAQSVRNPTPTAAAPSTATPTSTATTASSSPNTNQQQTRWEYLCDNVGGLATWQLAVDQGFAWTFYYLLSCGVLTAAGLHAWCEQNVPFLGMDFDSAAAKWGADYYWWGTVRAANPQPPAAAASTSTASASSLPVGATAGAAAPPVDVFDSFGNPTTNPLEWCYVSEHTLDRYSAAHKLAMLALPLQVAVVWGSYPAVFRVWSRTAFGRTCNVWAANMQKKLDNRQEQVKARKLF